MEEKVNELVKAVNACAAVLNAMGRMTVAEDLEDFTQCFYVAQDYAKIAKELVYEVWGGNGGI